MIELKGRSSTSRHLLPCVPQQRLIKRPIASHRAWRYETGDPAEQAFDRLKAPGRSEVAPLRQGEVSSRGETPRERGSHSFGKPRRPERALHSTGIDPRSGKVAPGSAVDDRLDAGAGDTVEGGEPLLNTHTGSLPGRLLSRCCTMPEMGHHLDGGRKSR